MVGIGLTVTVTVVVPTQPAALVPVTVYVVVAAGFAVTLVPVVADKPVAGDHVYVDAPLAVSVTAGEPAHLDAAGTVITGIGFTVTVVVVVPTQPAALVPVMV
jgi:hypothetical protein